MFPQQRGEKRVSVSEKIVKFAVGAHKGATLREMSKYIRIFVKNLNQYIDVEGGTTLLELARNLYPASEGEPAPICALVNNKTEHLGFSVFAPKMVEYLWPDSQSGQHVYIRSLCMILYVAVRHVDSTLRLRIEHSVSRGYYCRLFDPEGRLTVPSPEIVGEILAEMRRLVEADLPFERFEMLTSDVIDIFRAEGLDDKVKLLETVPELYTSFYRFAALADSYYAPLAPSSGHISVFDIQPYHDGFLLLGPDKSDRAQAASPVQQEKMFHAFTDHLEFNRIIRVGSVGELNCAVERNETSELINVAEAMHAKLIGEIADRIAERRANGEASIIMMAGPSSSGKTTTSKRLAIQLMTNLITPKLISLDDYFVDRHHTPRDEKGDYDYESLYALDLEQFNADLKALLRGEEINLPTYSFELGCRVEKPRPLRLDEHDVLVIEGIHGLNPELTSEIPAKDLFKVYVSALTTLSIDDHNWIPTSDNRLLRRIVRDYKYRHTSPEDTIRRWPSVRAGEEKWIFPFQENADATFNSSLIFEIGVMKPFAEPLLQRVPHTAAEYTQAYRLLRFLHLFKSIPGEQVPSTSLLREFLGGSSFHY